MRHTHPPRSEGLACVTPFVHQGIQPDCLVAKTDRTRMNHWFGQQRVDRAQSSEPSRVGSGVRSGNVNSRFELSPPPS